MYETTHIKSVTVPLLSCSAASVCICLLCALVSFIVLSVCHVTSLSSSLTCSIRGICHNRSGVNIISMTYIIPSLHNLTEAKPVTVCLCSTASNVYCLQGTANRPGRQFAADAVIPSDLLCLRFVTRSPEHRMPTTVMRSDPWIFPSQCTSSKCAWNTVVKIS